MSVEEMAQLTMQEARTSLQSLERQFLEGYVLVLSVQTSMVVSAYLLGRGYDVNNMPTEDGNVMVGIVTKAP